jgi:hypothetical protein
MGQRHMWEARRRRKAGEGAVASAWQRVSKGGEAEGEGPSSCFRRAPLQQGSGQTGVCQRAQCNALHPSAQQEHERKPRGIHVALVFVGNEVVHSS